MDMLAQILAVTSPEGVVRDLRVGVHWTAVVLETASGLQAGLAATQVPTEGEHGRPSVREAGRLLGAPAARLAEWVASPNPTERSIGLATLNAVVNRDVPTTEGNAEELLFRHGMGKRVAVVGHFPFVDRLRQAAAECWVLELRPEPTDLPADRAPEFIPQADVVAITAMTLLNGTFETLIRLPRPGAVVCLLGPSTPLSPLFFDNGVTALSGTLVEDIPTVLAAVSQGACFRQMPGRRLVTMFRPGAQAL
jgi:uncharacterized protein (DUF4213/DUF364 family)